MTSNLQFSILLISLFILFNLSYADDALIQSVCTYSNDKPFCLQQFRADPLSVRVDLNGLGVIAVNLVFGQASSTKERIPGLVGHTSDRLMKYRLLFCLQNYEDSLLKFNEAFKAVRSKAYRDVLPKIGQGFYNVTACEGIFSRGSHVQVSPFTDDTNLMVKLIELPALVVSKLLN